MTTTGMSIGYPGEQGKWQRLGGVSEDPEHRSESAQGILAWIWGLERVGVSLGWMGDTGCSECGLTGDWNVGLALQLFSRRPAHMALCPSRRGEEKNVG